MNQTSINVVVTEDDESSGLFLNLLSSALGFKPPASPPPAHPESSQVLEQTRT